MWDLEDSGIVHADDDSGFSEDAQGRGLSGNEVDNVDIGSADIILANEVELIEGYVTEREDNLNQNRVVLDNSVTVDENSNQNVDVMNSNEGHNNQNDNGEENEGETRRAEEPPSEPRLEVRVNLPLHLRVNGGRIYYISRRGSNGVIYLKCSKPLCGGTAKIVLPDIDVIIENRPHQPICQPNENLESVTRFKNSLRVALQSNWYQPRQLYDMMIVLYQEIRNIVPYNSIRTSILRWRKRHYPSNPSNMDEFGETLIRIHDDGALDYYRGKLRCNIIVDVTGNKHLVFCDVIHIRNRFDNVDTLLTDATFKTRPNVQGCLQVLTIMGVKYSHAIPLFYSLMSSKTKEAYVAIFQDFKEKLPLRYLQVILSDFEMPMREALRDVFPETRIAGCNVHFDRALLRYLHRNNLLELMHNNETIRDVIKKIMATAFLPAGVINMTIRSITSVLTPDSRRLLSGFLDYFDQQWIQGVSPDGFSIYNLERRTTNAIESLHSVYLRMIGNSPSCWAFITGLLKVQDNAVADEDKLSRALRVSRLPTFKSRFTNNRLTRVWHQYAIGEINNLELVEIISNLKSDSYLTTQTSFTPETTVEIENLGNINNENSIDPELRPIVQRNPTIQNVNVQNNHINNIAADDQAINDVEAEIWAVHQYDQHIDRVVQARNQREPRVGPIRNSNSRERRQSGNPVRRQSNIFQSRPTAPRRVGLQIQPPVSPQQTLAPIRLPVPSSTLPQIQPQTPFPMPYWPMANYQQFFPYGLPPFNFMPPIIPQNADSRLSENMPNQEQRQGIYSQIFMMPPPLPMLQQTQQQRQTTVPREVATQQQQSSFSQHRQDLQEQVVVQPGEHGPQLDQRQIGLQPRVPEQDQHQVVAVQPRVTQQNQQQAQEQRCIVCADREINAVFIPCGHLHCCYECALRISNDDQRCPVCRNEVGIPIRVYNN